MPLVESSLQGTHYIQKSRKSEIFKWFRDLNLHNWQTQTSLDRVFLVDNEWRKKCKFYLWWLGLIIDLTEFRLNLEMRSWACLWGVTLIHFSRWEKTHLNYCGGDTPWAGGGGERGQTTDGTGTGTGHASGEDRRWRMGEADIHWTAAGVRCFLFLVVI